MSIPSFTYDAIPGRVVFGPGSRRLLAAEATALGVQRVLLIVDPDVQVIGDEVAGQVGDSVVARFTDVVQHVPASKAKAASAAAIACGADTVVTVGGGSATGFGKAIKLSLDIRHIAVPTTYAGSEMTTIWGLTEGGQKRTGTDARVKPEVVVYDPELTLTLPPTVAASSGMNALAHSVEALYGPGSNPVLAAMALESIRALHRGLPRIVTRDSDLDAYTEVLYGAYLAGVALASGGTALHHKACHVLGGMFDLNHGDMNAVVLGHALAYNAPAIPDVMVRIQAALVTEDVPGAVFDLAKGIGAPTSLREIGMPAKGIDEAAREIVLAAAANVRPPTEESIRSMLDNAFNGRRPETSRETLIERE